MTDRAAARRARPRRRARSSGGRNWLAWLIPALIPAGAVVWIVTRPEAERRALLEQVPGGAGERALQAGLGLAALVALAWVLLPLVYWSHRGVRAGLRWYLDRSVGLKVTLLPAGFVLTALTGLLGLLFAVIAIAILAVFAGTMVLVVWIVAPGFLGGREALVEWVTRAVGG
jgi:hypothetical protein